MVKRAALVVRRLLRPILVALLRQPPATPRQTLIQQKRQWVKAVPPEPKGARAVTVQPALAAAVAWPGQPAAAAAFRLSMVFSEMHWAAVLLPKVAPAAMVVTAVALRRPAAVGMAVAAVQQPHALG